jgi:hypothetical protein
MFAGHAGLALAARARYRDVPLGTLIAAAFALDLAWPILLLLGVEEVNVRAGATAFNPLVFTSYPWTHSLAMAVVWGVLAAAVVRWRGYRGEVGLLAGLLVVSHWVLDAVVHAPDLPLWPADTAPLVGLGLWNSVPVTLLVEGALFAIGVALYWRSTAARTWAGSSGFWAFVIVVGIAWAAMPLLPLPADSRAVAYGAVALWLLPFWAAWFDFHRGRVVSAAEAFPSSTTSVP